LSIVLSGGHSDADYVCIWDDAHSDEDVDLWIMTGRTLTLVLPRLDLKRISLGENAPLSTAATMDWDDLPRQLKSVLTDVFSSPRLQSVHLITVESWSNPPLSYCPFSAMRRLLKRCRSRGCLSHLRKNRGQNHGRHLKKFSEAVEATRCAVEALEQMTN
jgi:hypothetical protein